MFPNRSPNVYGDGGTSYETALHIRHIPKDSLTLNEDHWIYFAYCESLGLPLTDEECGRIMHHTTARHDKKVYDIVTLSLPNGQTHVIYFDVTNYRYFWPDDR